MTRSLRLRMGCVPMAIKWFQLDLGPVMFVTGNDHQCSGRCTAQQDCEPRDERNQGDASNRKATGHRQREPKYLATKIKRFVTGWHRGALTPGIGRWDMLFLQSSILRLPVSGRKRGLLRAKATRNQIRVRASRPRIRRGETCRHAVIPRRDPLPGRRSSRRVAQARHRRKRRK